MTEVWEDIKGYEGVYKVSNLGMIKSIDRVINSSNGRSYFKKGIVLKPVLDEDGYYQVSLCKNGTQKEKKIHRLVMEAFTPNFKNKPEINHIDTIKTNNCISNLEWCTQIENSDHAIANGLLNPVSGEKHWKFQKKGGSPKRLLLDTQTGVFYDYVREAANARGIPYSTLSKKLGGERINNTSIIYV